jgi:uncharacterized protein
MTGTTLAGPREAFDHFRDMLLAAGSTGLDASLLAEDCVVEMPFAPSGAPRRIEGRDAFAAWAAPHRKALAGLLRFTAVRDVVVHETTNPEIAVFEYELEAVREVDGLPLSAPFVVVVRVREGRIALWREYQDPAAMSQITAT